MNGKIALDIVESVQPRLLMMLAYTCAAGLLVLLIKGRLESVVALITFSMNKELGKNTKVSVRGVEGVIIDYDIKWITIRTDKGVVLINMKRWQFEAWTVLYSDSNMNRRKTDSKK